MGNLSFTVTAFKARQSKQNRHDASAFLTNKTGAEKGEVLGLMTPCCSIVAH
jgi:hypothetical protein